MSRMSRKEELKRHTDQILQEIRIVLPGTQALMGFQFITFFNPIFQELPPHLKNLHFITLFLTIVCTIFLIAPVAFQQIGEQGSITEKFLNFTRTMLSVAMLCLLLAIVGDVYLAARTIGTTHGASLSIAGILLGLGMYLWYIYALIRRKNNSH
jgi:ABC-type proline/glycine betaine transport system permease subunit